MKKALGVIGVLVLLSGCATIVSLSMPGNYKLGEAFLVTIEAVPVDFSEECGDGVTDGQDPAKLRSRLGQVQEGECRPDGDCTLEPTETIGFPALLMKVPEDWAFQGCEFEYNGPPSAPQAGDIEEGDIPGLLEKIMPKELWEPGYQYILSGSGPPGILSETMPIKATCRFIPRGQCGTANLSYMALAIPTPGVDGNDNIGEGSLPLQEIQACLQEFTNWLIATKLLAARSVSCLPEPVPTVTGWGFIVLGLLLAASASWFIWNRKRRA